MEDCKAGFSGGFVGDSGVGSSPIQQLPVVSDAGIEPCALAIGGALSATGHLSARSEPQEGFGDPEGLCVVVASLVEGGLDPGRRDSRVLPEAWSPHGRR